MEQPRADIVASVLTQIADIGRDLAATRARPFGEIRLTRNQLDALFVLAHAAAPVTPGALATALTVTPGAVTQLVDALRGHGLVETAPHPDDGRARIVRLTDAAREQVESFERTAADRVAPRFAALSTAQLARLRDLLEAAQPGPVPIDAKGRSVEARAKEQP